MPRHGIKRGTPTTHYEPETGYTVVDVQETDEGPPPGTRLKPIVEEYEGQNFPYRGTETHGVNPLYDAPPSPEAWEGGMVEIDTSRLDEEPEKVIPVRIVAESTEEHESWSTQQYWVGNNPTQLAGRNTRRTALKIKNLSDTVVIYVGPNEMSTRASLGYPVDPGEIFSLTGSDQLWAVSATSDQVLVAVFMEYTVG